MALLTNTLAEVLKHEIQVSLRLETLCHGCCYISVCTVYREIRHVRQHAMLQSENIERLSRHLQATVSSYVSLVTINFQIPAFKTLRGR